MFALAWNTVKFVGVAVPVSIAFMDNIGSVARVRGSSMEPALHGDYLPTPDCVWLNTLAVRCFQIQRGDVVAFISPNDPKRTLIKRVVGLEGDVMRTNSYKHPVVRISEGSVWMAGDNTEKSLDSNTFGAVPRGLILAKATHVVWPPKRWGRLVASSSRTSNPGETVTDPTEVVLQDTLIAAASRDEALPSAA